MLMTDMYLSRSKLMASTVQVFQTLCLNLYGHFQQEQLKSQVPLTHPLSPPFFLHLQKMQVQIMYQISSSSLCRKYPAGHKCNACFSYTVLFLIPLQYGVILTKTSIIISRVALVTHRMAYVCYCREKTGTESLG